MFASVCWQFVTKYDVNQIPHCEKINKIMSNKVITLCEFKLKHPKILTTFKPILIPLFICGYNYDYFLLSRFSRLIGKLYCLLSVISLTYCVFTCCNSSEITIWLLMEYILSVATVAFTSGQTKSFFKILQEIDSVLRTPQDSVKFTSRVVIISIFFIFAFRVVYTVVCIYHYDCFKSSLVYYLPIVYLLTALDLYRFWRCAVLLVIRFRLKLLRLRLEELGDDSMYLHVFNNKTLWGNKIKVFLQLYKKFAESMSLINCEIHATIFVGVVCSLPKLIFYSYNMLLIFEDKKPLDAIGFLTVQVLQICIFLFMPFVIAELYPMEVENIKMILIKQLIYESDEATKCDIKMFLRYIKMNNFRYCIWRVMPLNASFPLVIINLCSTYVIVLINFTHLYD